MNKLVFCLLLLSGFLTAQTPSAPVPAKQGEDYSGMYSFLQEGEFVQVTIEEEGRVTGFISRYGDLESDKGQFLDHFFKEGKLDGHKISFTSATVHGVWFEFRGTIERGGGKSKSEDAYYQLQGTLTQNQTDANKKTSSKSREVTFKSFPDDAGNEPAKQH